MDADFAPMSGKTCILVSTVAVVTLASWLQERFSRTEGLAKESLVLAETGAYVFGTLVVAALYGGREEALRCADVKQYLMFMPVSLAFLAGNFLTYTAVQGLGASQFFLLSQLRVAITAVLLRCLKSVRASEAEWFALLQLCIGLILLVHLNLAAGLPNVGSSSGIGASLELLTPVECPRLIYPWIPKQGICWDSYTAALESAQMAAAAGADVEVDLYQPLVAFLGVLLCTAFAFIYMETMLKARKSESIVVQLHQLNFFGAIASFGMYMLLQSSQASGGFFQGWNIGVVFYWALCVSKGVMCIVMLKVFDSVVKGITDILAMVGVCVLQVVVDRQPLDVTRAGLQLMLILSIAMYLSARRLRTEVETGAVASKGGASDGGVSRCKQ